MRKYLSVFNPCCLISLLVSFFFARGTISIGTLYAFLPAMNGIVSAAAAGMVYWIVERKRPPSSRRGRQAVLTGALAGVLWIYALEYPEVSVFFFCLVVVAAYSDARAFFKKGWSFLAPDKSLTSANALELFGFMVSLMTSFMMLNLTLQNIYAFFGRKAFNFSEGVDSISDALYFTFTFMTTVGFGDIVPLNVVAKVVVAAECAVSYLCLALLIGVVNRGIRPPAAK